MQVVPIYSMTGFGRAEQSDANWHVHVDIKSLNGKQLELNLKLPPLLKSKEFDIRSLVANRLQRGSVECNITLKHNGATKPVVLNTDLIKAYYQTVQDLSGELGVETTNILGAILKLPEVVLPVTEVADEAGWKLVEATLEEAMAMLVAHRAEEGQELKKDLESHLNTISEMTEKVAEMSKQRPEYIRDSLRRKIEEHMGKENFDRNRLEQEIVYYIEKLDISEELVRLRKHCTYFTELINDGDTSKGKKLNFLLQEIGREINTTGAKAYDANMQKMVVVMKDALEKAKEQVLNVL